MSVKYLWYTNNTLVFLGWTLNQLQKSSYKVYNNFSKTETKFIMTWQGQFNDSANTWELLNIVFSWQTSYSVLKHHTECLKSNKDFKATSHRQPVPSDCTQSLSSHCPMCTPLDFDVSWTFWDISMVSFCLAVAPRSIISSIPAKEGWPCQQISFLNPNYPVQRTISALGPAFNT